MSVIDFEPVILVVDDDPDVLELLGMRIELLVPLKVIKETSPGKALEILKARDIPIVITDINMPEMSGVDLLRRINALLKGVQVIVMTAGTSTMNSIECFQQGASDFLIKPFIDEDIKKVLVSAKDRFERWRHFIHSRKVGEGLFRDA